MKLITVGWNKDGQVRVTCGDRERLYSHDEMSSHKEVWLRVVSENQALSDYHFPGDMTLATWVFMAGDPSDLNEMGDAMYIEAIKRITYGGR